MDLSRRSFVKSASASAAAVGFPSIVPWSALGRMSPSKRINVGAIGVGRISRVHDLPGIWQFDGARIMAVCDLDASRVEAGKSLINGVYGKQTGKPYSGVTGYDEAATAQLSRPQRAKYAFMPQHA